MSVKIAKRTASDKVLKLVSVVDDAIDWAASYDGEEGGSVDEKKRRHHDKPELGKIVVLKDEEGKDQKVTLFVFKHPARVDISRGVRGLITKQAQRGASADLCTDVFNLAFVGTEEGIDGGKLEEAPRRGHVIPDNYFQALEDTGAFEELALGFMHVANEEKEQAEVVRKK